MSLNTIVVFDECLYCRENLMKNYENYKNKVQICDRNEYLWRKCA